MFSIRARTLSGLSSFLDRSFGLSGSRCPSAHCPSPRGLRAARTGTVMAFASPWEGDARGGADHLRELPGGADHDVRNSPARYARPRVSGSLGDVRKPDT